MSLDLHGSILICPAKLQSHCEIWIAVYCCRNTKAVRKVSIHGYSAEKFLISHTRFINHKGCPKLIVTDQGTNFKQTGTATGVNAKSENLDWSQVQANHSLTEWNGLAEAMVNQASKCIQLAIQDHHDLKYNKFEVLSTPSTFNLLGLNN